MGNRSGVGVIRMRPGVFRGAAYPERRRLIAGSAPHPANRPIPARTEVPQMKNLHLSAG